MQGGLFEASKIILEIQFGEGGEDSKLFVHDLFAAYCKYAENNKLKVQIIATSDGFIKASIKGRGAAEAFEYESGKHVIQRIPPTERSGRKQTSVVTVAVLPIKKDVNIEIRDEDLEVITQGGHGPGGQHQNKTESAVRMRHLPTGIEVFINGRDQRSNRRQALDVIKQRVTDYHQKQIDEAYNSNRKKQRDGGGRSNKIRTYNFLNDRVVDHRFNIKCGDIQSIINKGKFERLLKKIRKKK